MTHDENKEAPNVVQPVAETEELPFGTVVVEETKEITDSGSIEPFTDRTNLTAPKNSPQKKRPWSKFQANNSKDSGSLKRKKFDTTKVQKEHDRKTRDREQQENSLRNGSIERKQLMKNKLNAIRQKRTQAEMNKLYSATMINSIGVVLQKEL